MAALGDSKQTDLVRLEGHWRPKFIAKSCRFSNVKMKRLNLIQEEQGSH